MTKAEIKEAAKQLVLSRGPSNVLEFGDEFVEDDSRSGHLTEADAAAIVEEAQRQARRVYNFLGYDAWR